MAPSSGTGMSVAAPGTTGPQADVVAVEAHVEPSDRDGRVGLDVGDHRGQSLGDPHAAPLQTDEHQSVEAAVALDDLMADPGQRPAQVVDGQHLVAGMKNAPDRGRGSRRWFAHLMVLLRTGLTGPA